MKINTKPLPGMLELLPEEQLELTKSPRLLLHAQTLSFVYKGISYNIESSFDAKTIFYNLMKG